MKRLLALSLTLILAISCVPILAWADPASDLKNQTVDPHTLNDWTELFGPDATNTDNAGAVWVDKSVFDDGAIVDGNGMGSLETALVGELAKGDMLDSVEVTQDDFMVVLSTMGSSKSIKGYNSAPTDTMLILDLSSSMYPNRNPSTVNQMVSAVNDTITNLLALDANNRIGVVVYFGNVDRNPSTAQHAMTLLSLGRYTAGANGRFIQAVSRAGPP